VARVVVHHRHRADRFERLVSMIVMRIRLNILTIIP